MSSDRTPTTPQAVDLLAVLADAKRDGRTAVVLVGVGPHAGVGGTGRRRRHGWPGL